MKEKLYAVDIGERRYIVQALTKRGAIAAVTSGIQVKELTAVEAVNLPADQEIIRANSEYEAPLSN